MSPAAQRVGFWYDVPQASLCPQFSEVPVNDDFISPEGSWCRKVSDTHAMMMDKDDSAYKVGELVGFAGHERVEYVPRRTKVRAGGKLLN